MRVLDAAPEFWRGYQRATFPAGSWGCEAGMLRTVAEAEPMDLITRQQYRHFELTLEWRAARGGKWHPLSCHRSAAARVAAWSGNAAARQCPPSRRPDAGDGGRGPLRVDRAAADRAPAARQLHYGPRRGPCQPRNRWLNGVVVAYAQSPALAALVAHSRFQALPGFGQAARGHMALQHHGAPVWFRHLSLRPLPDQQTVALPAPGPA